MHNGVTRRLAAVVLNFRTPDATVLAVQSLLASTRPVDDLIVVDNDTGPGCREKVAGLHPSVRYLSTGANLGFSGGMNVGIRAALAGGAYAVLLMNSDSTVSPDCLGHLEQALDSGAGIAGPVTFADSSHQAVVSAGIDYNSATGRVRERQSAPLGGPTTVDAVSGCVMLVKGEVFNRVGVLPEDYFFSYEDIDFCLRARNAGVRTVVAYAAVAFHAGSQTIGHDSPDRFYFAARNHLLLADRVTPASTLIQWVLRLSSIVSLNVAHALTSTRGSMTRRLAAVVRGTRDYFRGHFGGQRGQATGAAMLTHQLDAQVTRPRVSVAAAVDARILMYHRIAESSEADGLSVTPRHLRSHLMQLRDGGFTVVSLQDLAFQLANHTLPPRPVAITFDDGYLDTLTVAAPMLREFGYPATVFIVSGALDGRPFWWTTLDRVFSSRPLPEALPLALTGEKLILSTSTDTERQHAKQRIRTELIRCSRSERDRIVSELLMWSRLDHDASTDGRPMTAGEVATLASIPGIRIGAHTAHHLSLPCQPPLCVQAEVTESRHNLERLIGRSVKSFAFPYGAYDQVAIDALQQAGFAVAVTTEQRSAASTDNLLTLPRYGALNCDHLAFNDGLASQTSGSAAYGTLT